MKHIRDTLPSLRQRVSSLLQSARDELEALGDPRIGSSKVTAERHDFMNAYL